MSEQIKKQQDFLLFETWAKEHLGQGYSLEREDHTYINPVTRWAFVAYKAGRKSTLTQEQRSTIEEAAQVLESAASYNRSQSRTVLAHTQQNRADKLRAIIKEKP